MAETGDVDTVVVRRLTFHQKPPSSRLAIVMLVETKIIRSNTKVNLEEKQAKLHVMFTNTRAEMTTSSHVVTHRRPLTQIKLRFQELSTSTLQKNMSNDMKLSYFNFCTREQDCIQMGRRDFNNKGGGPTRYIDALVCQLVISMLKNFIHANLVAQCLELMLSTQRNQICTHEVLETR